MGRGLVVAAALACVAGAARADSIRLYSYDPANAGNSGGRRPSHF